MRASRPETSIIIRTFNEEQHLPLLLDRIESQRYKSYETIVVDSGSLDRTVQIALERKTKVVRIKSEDFTFGHSLNKGIEAAAGEYIVIVSAHTEPLEDLWLEKLVAPLKGDSVAMTFGKQRGNNVSKYSEVQDFRRTFGDHHVNARQGSFVANNANSALRKDLWLQHPFDEALPGLEDVEWARYWVERDMKVVYVPEAAILHIHKEGWSQVYNRYRREAIAARALGVKGHSSIVTEFFREAIYALEDLALALRDGKFTDAAREVLLFRACKYAGISAGLLQGVGQLRSEKKRESLYFRPRGSAVVVHGAGRAAFEEVEIPRPSPSEVLIRVAYEGVCGTDLEIYKGTLGYFKNGMASYPIIPGHELSGWITKVGANVKEFVEGERVVVECIQGCGICDYCLQQNPFACVERKELGVMNLNGGYSEYVKAQARFVHRIPDDLEMEKAALSEPLAVVHKGVKRLLSFVERKSGRSQLEIAVIGAGPIGYLSAHLLAHLGKKVVVFDKHPKRLSYYDNRLIRAETELAKVLTRSYFVEATGDPSLLHELLHGTPAGSTFLLLGLPYSRREFSFENIVAFDKTVIGSVGSGREDFEEALRLLPHLQTKPLLDNMISVREFEKAWRNFEQQAFLKTMLVVSTARDLPSVKNTGQKQAKRRNGRTN